MQFKYNEKTGINDIIFEETDICYDCLIDDKCPLVGALQYNIVYPNADIMPITYCELKV